MKRITAFASILALTSIAIAACAPPVEQIAIAEEQDSDNALLIQADFAGLVMTGVARSVSKDLDVYNVRPLIPLYNIRAASASLAYNAQTWPAGTVFVSVVDPGVGTDRKSVVLKTKNGLYFVSPDNGSLSGPATAYGIEAVREIDESVNRIPGSEWSHTFHGRDVYSYTGARLAAGVITYEEVGPLMEAKVIMLEELGARLEGGVLYGYVSSGTGRLGNISFSIDRHLFEEIDPAYGEMYDVVIRNNDEVAWEGSLPYAKSFGDVPLGDNLLFVNSSGNTSIAVNQGSFANKYGIGEGDSWTIEIRKH
jgi:S-adenosylmethionine hydrolase